MQGGRGQFGFVRFGGAGFERDAVMPLFSQQGGAEKRKSRPDACFPPKLNSLDLRDSKGVDEVVVGSRGVVRMLVGKLDRDCFC